MQVGFPEQRPAGEGVVRLAPVRMLPRHDPAGVALSDAPQAKRSGGGTESKRPTTAEPPARPYHCPDARAARRSLAVGDNREVPEGVVLRPVG